MRGLSDVFLNLLTKKNSLLKPFLHLVQNDSTLCLQIRENCINIYYRGGNILKIELTNTNKLKAFFDKKYLRQSDKSINLPDVLCSEKEVSLWTDAFPNLKYNMDLWFAKHPRNEREFQQLVVRENNLGKTGIATDYFICDIEYENTYGKFDMIAVKWPSSGISRKNNKDIGLACIEMKYADQALGGIAGLKKHLKDIDNYFSFKKNISFIKKEMKIVFNQLQQLELINCKKEIVEFSNEKPECIIILANHDPEKSKLRCILNDVSLLYKNINIKFAVSNFMGYGLYEQCIFSFEDFLKRYKEQI